MEESRGGGVLSFRVAFQRGWVLTDGELRLLAGSAWQGRGVAGPVGSGPADFPDAGALGKVSTPGGEPWVPSCLHAHLAVWLWAGSLPSLGLTRSVCLNGTSAVGLSVRGGHRAPSSGAVSCGRPRGPRAARASGSELVSQKPALPPETWLRRSPQGRWPGQGWHRWSAPTGMGGPARSSGRLTVLRLPKWLSASQGVLSAVVTGGQVLNK